MPWSTPIKPVVSEVLPNTAQALQAANATPQEIAMSESLAFAYQKGIQLRKLPQNVAQNEYAKLSDPAKQDINTLFGNDPYLQGAPSFGSKIVDFGKNVLKFAASPILYGYSKVAPTYEKTLATPMRVGFETTSLGKNLFSPGTWSEAFQGKDLYNPNDVARLNKTYGKATAAVAMGIVAGKTPAEIMQEYSKGGAWDPELGKALTASLDDPNFQKIIDDVKLARFTPGNSLVRSDKNHNEGTVPETGGALANKFSRMAQQNAALQQGKKYNPKTNYLQNNTETKLAEAGGLDFIYSVIADPLTWITGGGSAGSKGTKLADSIYKAASEGRLAEKTNQIFARKDIADLWNNTIGPSVQKVVDAKNDTEKAAAYENFKFTVPGYDNREIINTLVKGNGPNKPIVNAKEAEEFFQDIENTHMLLNGRVDGTNFYRNGILTARNNRIINQGLAKSLDAIFNPSLKNVETQAAISAAEKTREENWKILSTVGPTEDQGINRDAALLNNMADNISKTQRLGYKLGNLLARSPQGGFILYGNDAEKTINNFINITRLVLPRDQAKILAETFVKAPVNQQIATVRNIYFAYMQKMGLEGTEKGREYIQQVLNKFTNDENGFGSSGITELPSHFVGMVDKNTVKYIDDVPLLAKSGTPQPSMLTNAIAPLDFSKIAQLRDFGETHRIWSAVDKATKNQLLKKYTNFWSFETLLPRLGIRSTADEAFMYLWNQPLQDVLRFFSGGGRREGKVLTAVAGNRDSVGPIKAIYNNLFKNGGPERYFTIQDRSDIIENLAEELSVKFKRPIPVTEVANYLKREAITSRAWDVYLGNLPKGLQGDKEALINGVKYSPDFLSGTVNALTAKTGLTGSSTVDDIRNIMFEPSVVDKAVDYVGKLGELKGLKVSKKFYNVPAKELEAAAEKKLVNVEKNPWSGLDQESKDIQLQKLIALSHIDNFGLRFSYNSIPINDGKIADEAFIFNPVPAFFKNNALKTKLDLRRATNALLKDVGIEEDSINGITRTITNPERIESFNSMFVDTLNLQQKGLDAVQIARVHIETMLTDMYVTFHGDKGFNEELLNRIKEAYTKTFKDTPKKVSDSSRWKTAVNSIEFPEFEKLTVNKHPIKGGVNTRIEYPDVASFTKDDASKRITEYSYETMDRQINGFFRQPALVITYARIYKQNKPFIDLMKKRTLNNLFQDALEKNNGFMPSPNSIKWMTEQAENFAAKWGAEISMNEATSTILKFADNPSIRSNLAASLPTLGRFYRANEDFARRAYRMSKQQPLTAFYRMRLVHTAVASNGAVYKDANGDEYIIAPTDSILFKPISTVLNYFYPGRNDLYKGVQFDDIKLKLSLIDPSLAADASEPMFSGPASALSVWALSNLLNYAGKEIGSSELVKAGNIFDNIITGQNGSNVSWWKALVPMQVSNLYDMLPFSESSKQFNTAAQAGINYLYGAGNGLPSNPTVQQKRDFLRNVKVATHSILFMRAALGFISPITPSLQESKTVPDYYKKIGITAIRPEFFQILQGIKDTYPDVQDAYSLATGIFIGKNPGKSIYTTSRSNKKYQVLLDANQNVMDWTIQNNKWIDGEGGYGTAALVFAPKIGSFDNYVYGWMQSQDMVTLPTIDEYFAKASVAADKERYFAVANEEKDGLIGNSNLSDRQRVIKEAAQKRAGILASNPDLAKELANPSTSTQSESEVDYGKLKQLVALKDAPINPEDRVQMNAAIKIMDGFVSQVTDPEFKSLPNFTEIKTDSRNQAEASIENIAKLNPAVSQAYQYIFKNIMNKYVPEKYAVIGGK